MMESIERSLVIQTDNFDFRDRTHMDSVTPVAEDPPEVLMEGDEDITNVSHTLDFDFEEFLNTLNKRPLPIEQELPARYKNIDLFEPVRRLIVVMDDTVHLQAETISPLGKPSNVEYPGPYNFRAQCGADIPKSKFQYSYKLKRMYIKIDTKFAMQFKWNFDEVEGPLFIRATPIFTNEHDSSEKITACPNHCKGDEIMRHHFICSSEKGRYVYYCGNGERPESWLSVAVRLPESLEPGVGYFSHIYSFRCMSTCSTMVRRRPIAVAFTLENAEGDVLGRHMQSVIISTSPGRDCDLHEGVITNPSAPKKRGRKTSPKKEKSAKRAKMEKSPPTPPTPTVCDADIFVLPNIQVVGVEDYKKIMEYVGMVLKARQFDQPDDVGVKEVCLRGIDACERASKHAKEQAEGNW